METANAELAPTALKILEKKLPMHMDKPGGDAELFDRLSREYERLQLPFQMGYMLRVNPALQFCTSMVKLKAIHWFFIQKKKAMIKAK